MSHRPAAVIVAAIAAALAVLPAAAAPAQPRETLRATVGPGFSIFLRHADGTAVTQLDAGEYAIVVEDKAIEHNFHLLGAGVDQFTSVENVENATWTVVFADVQIYRFQCDPHSTTMRGSFTVGNVPDPPPPPVVRRLSASVSASAISVKTSSGAEGARRRRRHLPHRGSGHGEDAELPPHRARRQQEDDGCRSRPGRRGTCACGQGSTRYRSDKKRRLRGSVHRQVAPLRGLDQARLRPAGRADVGLTVELGVQLRSEEDRPRACS